MVSPETEALAFDAWLGALNSEAFRQGYVNLADLAAGKTLTDVTGEECWRDYYADGMTPAEALAEDEAELP